MEWWDYLNANPKLLEDFGEAMKANSHASLLRGSGRVANVRGVGKVADIAGGFGHLAVALLEKYPDLRAVVQGMFQELVSRWRASVSQVPDAAVARRLEYVGAGHVRERAGGGRLHHEAHHPRLGG